MYVNPFERMRKKREEEEKQKLHADKLRERYLELGAQIGIVKPDNTPTYIKTYIDPHEDLKYKNLNYEDEQDNLNNQQNINNKIINNTQSLSNKSLIILDKDWLDQFFTNTLENQIFGYLNSAEELNKFKQQLYANSASKLIELDIGKITKYSSSLLFMLKQIINKLPTIITIEDKRVLWERTSIFLSSTKFITIEDTETLEMVKQLNIEDPISLFIEEFISIFESYSIYDPIILTLENTNKVDVEDLLEIIDFISKLLVNIPNFKFILNIEENQYFLLESRANNFIQQWITINESEVLNQKNKNDYDLEQIQPINEYKQTNLKVNSPKNYQIDVNYYLQKQAQEEYEKRFLSEKSKNKEPIEFHDYFLESENESQLSNIDKINDILDGNTNFDNQYINIQRNLQRQNPNNGKTKNMISVPGGWNKLKK